MQVPPSKSNLKNLWLIDEITDIFEGRKYYVYLTYEGNPEVCIKFGGFGHFHLNCDGDIGDGKT